MKFAERLKDLRNEKGITQVQLAAELGISKGTVAMWETGKREPNFETVCTLSDYFDRRVDYILGHSEDKSSAMMTAEDYDELGRWEVENNFHETMMSFLCLDEYGKSAVESLILEESRRCREQSSLFPESNFSLRIRIKKEDVE